MGQYDHIEGAAVPGSAPPDAASGTETPGQYSHIEGAPVPGSSPPDPAEGSPEYGALSPEARGAADARKLPGWKAYPSALEAGFGKGYAGNLTERLDALREHLTGQGNYDERLRYHQGYHKALEDRYKGTTLGGQLLGLMSAARTLGGAWGKLGLSTSVGAPWYEKMLEAGVQGSAFNALYGALSGEGAQDRAQKAAEGVAPGFLLGAGLERVGSAIGAGWRHFFGGANQASPEVERAAQAAGISTKDYIAQRVAQAKQYGIELTRGQSTGNLGQQRYENAAAEGAFGRGPASTLGERLESQKAAIERGRANLIPESADDLGETVQQGIRERTGTLQNIASSYYHSAEATGTAVTPQSVETLGRRLIGELEDHGIQMHEGMEGLPGTKQAMNLINKRLLGEDLDPRSLTTIDNTRRFINQEVKAANSTDAAALGVIRRTYDNWFNDLATRDLFSGSPQGIEFLKRGRRVASEYLQALDDKKALGQLMHDGLGPDVAANWMTNATNVNQAQKAANLASSLREFFGPESKEWAALRSAIWKKATVPIEGRGAAVVAGEEEARFGTERLAKNILSLTDGPGRVLAREVYSPEELEAMRWFARAAKTTVPDPRAINPPRSGYEPGRQLAEMGLPGILGAYTGYQQWRENGHSIPDAIRHGLIVAGGAYLFQKMGAPAWKAKAALKPVASEPAMPGATVPVGITPLLAPTTKKKMDSVTKALGIANAP